MVPKALRKSPSKICGELGITWRQYDYWKRHPKITRLVETLTLNYFRDDIPDVLMAVRNAALAGDVAAAKTFFEMITDKLSKATEEFYKRQIVSKGDVTTVIEELRRKKI